MTLGCAPRRYAVIGALCAALNVVLMGWFELLGIHWLTAAAMNFPILVAVGYVLHARWTFETPMSWTSLGRYAFAMAANYPAYTALLFLLCGFADLPAGPATAITTALLFVWNFIASRWAIVPRATSLARSGRIGGLR
jgi:putative flippase GtrA